MATQRTRNTAPELALRRELHRRGVRFRLQRPGLPGRPDIVLVRCQVAVFVDGCFWHGCDQHFTLPRANREWWAAKIARNRERDAAVAVQLAALGWSSVRVWEHEDPIEAAAAIERLWRQRAAPRQSAANGHD